MGDEYKGSTGTFASGDKCLATVANRTDVNFAIWRGDGNGGCYVCALTGRGATESWSFFDLKDAISYVHDGYIPPVPPTLYYLCNAAGSCEGCLVANVSC